MMTLGKALVRAFLVHADQLDKAGEPYIGHVVRVVSSVRCTGNDTTTQIVAALHDEHGRVAIPGFYDDVEELTDAEAASMAAVPFDQDAWLAAAGVQRTEGEEGRTILERTSTRPTCQS